MSENWYDRHVLPYLIDLACGMAIVTQQRAALVPRARGRVLEVGIGTGLNIPHYDPARVSLVVGVDPALRLHRLARKRIEAARIRVELVGLSAERLPLPDASFDTVVMTYTLCSIVDPLSALREMRRVLAPGGRMIFCEHGRAPDESVRRWQRRIQPLWGRCAGGCHVGRDIPALLEAGGFRPDPMNQAYRQGPKALAYTYWGEAVGAQLPS